MKGPEATAVSRPRPTVTGWRRIRARLVVWLVRVVAAGLRRLGAGGGTLPGRVGRRLAADLLTYEAARLPRGVVMVTGTNGKTTTAHLLRDMLGAGGLRVAGNQGGANLLSGLTTALALAPPEAEIAVLETDEATVPRAAWEVGPRVVAVSNFFRDQLDRYGELSTTIAHVRRGLAALPSDGVAVLNADDPNVAALAASAPHTVFYGVETTAVGSTSDRADARRCPRCGAPLEYASYRYAHLGTYQCRACGFARPEPDLTVYAVAGAQSQQLRCNWHGVTFTVPLSLPGTYNAYNAAMAAATALELGMSVDAVSAGIRQARASFGRMETLTWRGVEVCIALVKNPTGFNQVLDAVASDPGRHDLVIVINDRDADGRDVSWLWDVDLESFVARRAVDRIFVGGTRANDMAVRLKYAGIEPGQVTRCPGPPLAALEAAVDSHRRDSAGGRIYVLPTYTALLALRGRLAEEGVVRHFREG